MKINYYDFLGIPMTADETAIKKAHRDILIKYHPDNYASADETEKQNAKKQIDIANEGLNILLNKNSRQKYDLSLKSLQEKTSLQRNTSIHTAWNNFGMFSENFNWNTYEKEMKTERQKHKEQEQKEFSELLNKIKDAEEKRKKIQSERENLENQLQQLIEANCTDYDHKLKEMYENIKKNKEYEEASIYIEKFINRDRFFVTRIFITKKQVEFYQKCKRLIEDIEEQIEAHKASIRQNHEKEEHQLKEKISEKEILETEYSNKIFLLKNLCYGNPHYYNFEGQMQEDIDYEEGFKKGK